jgi:hypothetical protein
MHAHNFSFKVAFVLSLLGGGLHYASLRWSLFQSSPAEPSTRLLVGPIVVWSYVLLGGILYGAFLGWPVSQALYQAKISFFTLLKGGLLGMLATIAALQGRYVAMGCLITHQARTVDPVVRAGSFKSAFLITMIPVETFGIIEFFRFAIPAFLCGMLITGLARALRGRSATDTTV